MSSNSVGSNKSRGSSIGQGRGGSIGDSRGCSIGDSRGGSNGMSSGIGDCGGSCVADSRSNSVKGSVSVVISIRISVSRVEKGGISLSLSISRSLLPAARNSSSEVVCAQTNIGGMGQSIGSSSNGMGIGTIGVCSCSVGVSISRVKEGWVSLGISITLSKKMDSMTVCSIAISTRNRDIGSIYTRGRLAICIGISISVGVAEHLGLSISSYQSNKGRSKDLKILI